MASLRPVRATIDVPWAGHSIRRLRGLAWLAIITATVAVPASAFGATPGGGGGGDGQVTEPGGNMLGVVLGVAVALATIAVALAVLIGLAYVVARIGGPPVAPASEPGSTGPDRPRSAIGTTVSVLVAVGSLVVGVLAGREIAHSESVGGLEGILGEVFLFLFLVVTVVALALVGLIATKIRHGHVSQAIGTMLAAAGLLATGAFVGNATAAVSGGLYQEPVVLLAAGETRFTLQADAVAFAGRDGGQAECRSDPDGRAVAQVTALDLGERGSGTLRATLRLPGPSSNGATAEFWIDGGDLPDGSIQPFWGGSVEVIEMAADGASGRLTFDGLEREGDGGKPAPESSTPTSPTDWPSKLSGALSWTCQPW